MTVVSISMPEALRTTVDQYAETHGYAGRSDVVRQALREFCADTESTDEPSTPQLATLVVCFEYGDTSVERQVATVRREANCVIAHAHGHAAGCCLETIVVYATATQRQTLTASLRAITGVDGVDQSVAALPENQLAAGDS